jgi:hypothetical protein
MTDEINLPTLPPIADDNTSRVDKPKKSALENNWILLNGVAPSLPIGAVVELRLRCGAHVVATLAAKINWLSNLGTDLQIHAYRFVGDGKPIDQHAEGMIAAAIRTRGNT